MTPASGSGGAPLQWDDSAFRVASDNARTASRRMLQSWYRQKVLKAAPGIDKYGIVRGSMLDSAEVAEAPTLNFLDDPEIYAVVEDRLADPSGTVEKDRLMRNLLSSMPLCFNLFGKLGTDPPALAAILRRSGIDVADVTEVRIEWAPGPKSEHLNDNTAFDAFVEYSDSEDRKCFLGIETKYTESFSPREYDTEVYQSVTGDEANGFTPGAADVLVGSKSNQLWRNLMLAMSTRHGCGYDRGRVVVVSLHDDPGALQALTILRSNLKDPEEWLSFIPMEQLVGQAALEPDLASWATEFTRRYLDLGPVVRT